MKDVGSVAGAQLVVLYKYKTTEEKLVFYAPFRPIQSTN